MRICHMTSAHEYSDDRIFIKECTSLAENGYETFLVSKGSSKIENGINVVGAGEMPQSRWKRMTGFTKEIYKLACKLDCEVYHFHDPELLPYGRKLKKWAKQLFLTHMRMFPLK